MKRIAIVGGGIAGLTAAWLLHKKHQITLFEKSDRVGGWIQTVEKEGFLFERGPRGFRSNGKHTLQLCEELDLHPLQASLAAKRRYLWLDERLREVTPTFFLQKAFFPCIRELFISRGFNEETIGSFFTRRFGKSFTQTFVDPMVSGIFGGDLNQLSMESCFPKIKSWERNHGSVVRGFFSQRKSKERLLSFENGMESLPKRLFEKLEKYIVLNSCFEEGDFDHVIMATPQVEIPHETITTVNLGWHERVLPFSAFGYLVPSSENEEILGVTFDSEIFPRRGTTLCVMIRGVKENPLMIALNALEKHLKIGDLTATHDIHVASQAIPQYRLGVKKRKNEANFIYMSNCIGINDTIDDVYNQCSTI
jgi:oxygen-dependent protoporphyrinogen oxidase